MNDNDISKYCKILGLKPDASFTEIKQAYRKRVKAEHPDLFNNPQQKRKAEENFKKVTEAYEKLRKFYHADSSSETFASFNDSHSTHTTNSANSSNNSHSTHTTNSANSSNDSHSTHPTNSILSNLRPYLGRAIILVIGVNIVNIFAWIYIASNNSKPQNSSPPQPNVRIQTNSPAQIVATAQPQQCRVVAPTIGNSARVFSQPSRNADIGKRLAKDTKVSFISGMHEFVEIELPDRSRGWVFNDQVHPCTIPSNSLAQIASISVQPQQCLVIAPTAGRGARIFSQPSRNADLGKRIPRDTSVSLLRQQGEFVEIRLSDRTQGWVFNDQVHPCTVPSNSSAQITSSVQPQQCLVIAPTTGRGARIFSQPSRNADIGKRIPRGTTVSLLKQQAEFVEIRLGDHTGGWVFNDQVHPCSPS